MPCVFCAAREGEAVLRLACPVDDVQSPCSLPESQAEHRKRKHVIRPEHERRHHISTRPHQRREDQDCVLGSARRAQRLDQSRSADEAYR